MSNREIPAREAALLLDKMTQENLQVVAYFVRDGVQTKMRGFVNRVTTHTGVEIITELVPQPKGYLVVPVGDPFGSVCKFGYGETREVNLQEHSREELNEKLGESVLLIYGPAGQLRLFFNP